MTTSTIRWGALDLPNPRRDSTGEGSYEPIGSLAIGPDNDVFSTLYGYRRTLSYSFHNLSEAELTIIKNAYRTYSRTPTTLVTLTGTELVVIAPEPFRWGSFHDRFHVPHYACTVNWWVVTLVPALTP